METKLILVAVEMLCDSVMRKFLFEHEHLVQFIAFDEAQVIVQCMSYRPCMAEVKFFLDQARGQVVLLSATCPPEVEKTLGAELGTDNLAAGLIQEKFYLG